MNRDDQEFNGNKKWLELLSPEMTYSASQTLQQNFPQMANTSIKSWLAVDHALLSNPLAEQMRKANAALVETMSSSAMLQPALDVSRLGLGPSKEIVGMKANILPSELANLADQLKESVKIPSISAGVQLQVENSLGSTLKALADQQLLAFEAIRPAQCFAESLAKQYSIAGLVTDQMSQAFTSQYAEAIGRLSIPTPQVWESLEEMFSDLEWDSALETSEDEAFVVESEDIDCAARFLLNLEADSEFADQLLTTATGTRLSDFQLMTKSERLNFVGATLAYLYESVQALISAGGTVSTAGICSKLLVFTVLYALAIEAINQDVQARRDTEE